MKLLKTKLIHLLAATAVAASLSFLVVDRAELPGTGIVPTFIR